MFLAELERLRSMAIVVTWCICSSAYASAADRVPFSDFDAMSTSDLDSLQIKCTWVTNSFVSRPSLVITAQGHGPDLSLFAPYYREEFRPHYSVDSYAAETVTLTTTELAALIDDLAALPGVTDGGVDTPPSLSFSLYNVVDGVTKVFEAILNEANIVDAFKKLEEAPGGGTATARIIRDYVCECGMQSGTPPTDVTSSIGVTFGGIRRNRHGVNQFVQRVRVRNTSQQTITAPIWLALGSNSNVRLLNDAGRTCVVEPRGLQYVVAKSSGSLTPNQFVDLLIGLTNPNPVPVKFVFRKVYAGSGQP